MTGNTKIITQGQRRLVSYNGWDQIRGQDEGIASTYQFGTPTIEIPTILDYLQQEYSDGVYFPMDEESDNANKLHSGAFDHKVFFGTYSYGSTMGNGAQTLPSTDYATWDAGLINTNTLGSTGSLRYFGREGWSSEFEQGQWGWDASVFKPAIGEGSTYGMFIRLDHPGTTQPSSSSSYGIGTSTIIHSWQLQTRWSGSGSDYYLDQVYINCYGASNTNVGNVANVFGDPGGWVFFSSEYEGANKYTHRVWTQAGSVVGVGQTSSGITAGQAGSSSGQDASTWNNTRNAYTNIHDFWVQDCFYLQKVAFDFTDCANFAARWAP
jgi:hypothetical protein